MSRQNAHLWVEGLNDQHVVWALCQAYQIKETFDVRKPDIKVDGNGIEAALKAFRLSMVESGKQAVGLVIDADEYPERRWQQIHQIIQKSNRGYVLPELPATNGVIIFAPTDYLPRIGIWLMPDNRNQGMLEDFATYLIPANDKLQVYANHVLDDIEEAIQSDSLDPETIYAPIHRSKAFIHTWLAWQRNPGMPMGQAITAKALSAHSPLALTFVDWLNRLFNP